LAVLYQCPVDAFLSGVDDGYNDIIESAIPVDAKRHYAAKGDSVMARLQAALVAERVASEAAPTPIARPDAAKRWTGKSARVRVRRKPGK
jgi:hypothetical protein